MNSDTSSSNRRVDPDLVRRDYLCARVALARSLITVEDLEKALSGREPPRGTLAKDLGAAGSIDRAAADALAGEVERRAGLALDERELRGIDEIFRQILEGKKAVRKETLGRFVAVQAEAFRPLWELLSEAKEVDPVLARILEARARARYFQKRLVALLAREENPASEEGPVGRTLGRYRILREIGRDRLGIVYEALRDQPESRVALRVLPPETAPAKRLRRARESLDQVVALRHDQIRPIKEVGYEGETIYVVYPLVQGETLPAFLARKKPSLEVRLGVVRDVARALDFAHRRGILHRDLRPANILVGPKARATLTDFCMFRFLGIEEDVETLPYRAPEDLAGREAKPSQRSDIYALGAVLYELVTGTPPFHGRVIQDLRREIAGAAHPDPDLRLEAVDTNLAAIVRRAIAPRPEDRTSSASELAHELTRFLSPESRPDLGPAPSGPIERPYRSRTLVASAVALSMTIGAALLLVWAPWRESPSTDDASGESPDAESLLRRGRLQFARGDFDGALGLFQLGLAADPDDARIPMEHGRTLLALGRFAEASASLERAVLLAPDSLETRYYLAEAEYRAGNAGPALSHIDRYLERVADSKAGSFLRARILLASERSSEAFEALRRSSLLPPAGGESLFYIAVLRLRKVDARGAKEALAEFAPTLAQKGEAALDRSEAARLLGEDAYFEYAVGSVRAQIADTSGALEAWQRCIEKKPPAWLVAELEAARKELGWE